MIKFERYTLNNGLKVILHRDTFTPMVTVNMLYDVGSRDEEPERTGFAHLFEHLMFGGSVNIPQFDKPLQEAGGENNAFTNNDFTDYYITLPAENLETAFWLESDRMLQLAFSGKSLDVQKNVVIEEYKQRYLNQPYGDSWLLLRPLAYRVHPYNWTTIGKDISHIEKAELSELKDFFYSHYAPNNAILTIAGNIDFDHTKLLVEKWFASIEKRQIKNRNLPVEPVQTEERKLEVKRKLPFDAVYKAWHISNRKDTDYPAYDLISDVLSNGKSSRLYVELVKKRNYFSDISAFVTGDLDEGLLVITGRLMKNVSLETADKAILEVTEKLKSEYISEHELNKVKNKVESSLKYSEMNTLNKALNLAFYELLGDANALNSECEKYASVTAEQIRDCARKVLIGINCSTLYYIAEN